MADTDLLVHASDLPAMHRIMTTLGYKADDAAKCQHHIAYRHPEKKMVGSTPYVVVGHTMQGLDNFWRQATPFQLEGRQALVLAPADAFLHLALHAAAYHRMWRGLRSLLDMLLLTRANRQPDFWASLREAADEIGFAGVFQTC